MHQEDDSCQRFTLTKSEHLRSRKDIELLLQQNKVSFAYPFKCCWQLQLHTDSVPAYHRIAMAVPKRLFKHAVDRNRIKRLVREAYRLNKAILYEGDASQKVDMLFVCVCKEIPSYYVVAQSVKNILKQIASQLQ
ncbi:MAG: ribonuclease P protein component [Bacteroidales bacterium]|jgi:ribonuclease P protein component|nr:ribonuclease P protein component [Bacteroidales bacterium]